MNYIVINHPENIITDNVVDILQYHFGKTVNTLNNISMINGADFQQSKGSNWQETIIIVLKPEEEIAILEDLSTKVLAVIMLTNKRLALNRENIKIISLPLFVPNLINLIQQIKDNDR